MKADNRIYKVKNSKKEFFCALCRKPRQMRFESTLTTNHYVQLVLFYTVSLVFLYPWLNEYALFLIVPYWMFFEFVIKLLYRKELRCPYCGFDAVWYRRDVKVARRIVQDFMNKPQTADAVVSNKK